MVNIHDLRIESPEIGPESRLHHRHAFDRENKPPILRISGVPRDAVELAIVCHDPDAPLPYGFTHWTVYGVPADTTEISAESAAEFREGPNDFGRTGYGGPRPPEGHGPHHYYFWVYALTTHVEGEPTLREFLERYAGDIIEQNRVVGIYER